MQLPLLWDLQELDLAIGRLNEKIEHNPLQEEARNASAALDGARRELAEGEENLKAQRKQLKKLELDLQKISASQDELRRKLYGGEVANVKELEQMEKKLNLVEKNKQALEEETLAQMESVEELELSLQELSGRVAESESARQEKEKQLQDELAHLREEQARLEAERGSLAAKIEPRFLELYDTLCRRHQGRGLARVVNDICEGCSVFISSAQRGFLYNPDAMVYCESCGRLLVKLDREAPAVEQ